MPGGFHPDSRAPNRSRGQALLWQGGSDSATPEAGNLEQDMEKPMPSRAAFSKGSRPCPVYAAVRSRNTSSKDSPILSCSSISGN